MKKIKLIKWAPLLVAALFLLPNDAIGQRKKKEKKEKESEEYVFTKINEVPATAVKSQDRVGSCWDYAATSFVESELLRMGKPELNLSEMFTIRYDYINKANWYVRMHGNNNFAQGGQGHDVINVIREYGFVPEDAYPGIEYGEERHNHGELTPMLKAVLDVARQKKLNRKMSPVWTSVFENVLETYLGEAPEEFDYEGKTYTPIQFRDEMGFNADDYIELTSFNHRPMYRAFSLEVPDNWSHDLYYNLPIEELLAVAHHAFENGYSVCWDGDVSEAEFAHGKGYAVVPAEPEEDSEEKVLLKDRPEISVCQCKRQEAFDDQVTTDDHLMHMTGVYQDEKGSKYFKTKNSWGEKSNDFGGYLYISETYFKYKTVAIMIHKDALPSEIKEKLGL